MGNNEFKRVDSLFSLCGLNCSLCSNLVRGMCPGCQVGSHCASVCPFAPCSVEHGDVTYCFECEEYPCKYYDGVDEHDSLMTHRNQLKDIEKAQRIGIEHYHNEQSFKKEILSFLLGEFDSGNNDVYFCTAVNLLELEDLKEILEKAVESTDNMGLDEKCVFIKGLFEECALKRGIELELRRDGYYG